MFSILGTLMSGLFGKAATTSYPLKPKVNDPLVRGHIHNDIDSCIFCGICRKKCPTMAIGVNRDEKTWAIERFLCVQCNCCVEVCPKKCLYMKNELTPVSTVPTKDVVKAAQITG